MVGWENGNETSDFTSTQTPNPVAESKEENNNKGNIKQYSFQKVSEKSGLPPKDFWKKRPKWQELLDLQEKLSQPPDKYRKKK